MLALHILDGQVEMGEAFFDLVGEVGGADEIGDRARVAGIGGIGQGLVPIAGIVIAPAKPGEGDDLGEFVLVQILQRVDQLLIGRVVGIVLQHIARLVVRCAGIRVGLRGLDLHVELARLEDDETQLVQADGQFDFGGCFHVLGPPRLGSDRRIMRWRYDKTSLAPSQHTMRAAKFTGSAREEGGTVGSGHRQPHRALHHEIGRASCRERV
jgi:hypothetical protein